MIKKKNVTDVICSNCNSWKKVKNFKCCKCGKEVQPGDAITVVEGESTCCTVYRPKRPSNMTPIQYYKKYKCVDDNYTRKTNGRYYCNPAHCSKSWLNKKTRDDHLNMAYNML